MGMFKVAVEEGISEAKKEKKGPSFGRRMLHVGGTAAGAGLGALALGLLGARIGVAATPELRSSRNFTEEVMGRLIADPINHVLHGGLGAAIGAPIGAIGGGYLGHLLTRPGEEE